MFGTWKVDPETEKLENLRRAYDPITARSSQHQACDRCHEKKLKCSGEKEGCDRCAGSRHKCEYTRSGSHSSRKGKKSPSGSPGSRGSSHKGQSSKPRSSGSSHRGDASTTRASGHGGHGGHAASQAGYPVASQADAYGMGGLYTSAYDASPMPHYGNLQQDGAAAYQTGWAAADASMHVATTTPMHQGLLAAAGQMYGGSADYQYQYQEEYDGYQNVDPRYWPQ